MAGAAQSPSSSIVDGLRGIWFSLLAPPVAWALQGGVSWVVADRVCGVGFAADDPDATAARLAIGLLSLVAIVVSVAAAWRVHEAWRLFTDPGPLGSDGETRRFLALAGLLTSVTLTLGLVLAGLPALALSGCGLAR